MIFKHIQTRLPGHAAGGCQCGGVWQYFGGVGRAKADRLAAIAGDESVRICGVIAICDGGDVGAAAPDCGNDAGGTGHQFSIPLDRCVIAALISG